MLIGHYYYKKETNDRYFSPSFRKTLSPLTDENFFSVIDSITPVCPLSKEDAGYKDWKGENLPLLYFTNKPKRPDEESSTYSTGYAMIDVDNMPNKRLESSHPSVVAINYTGNGTHFIIRGVFGSTPREWQLQYNRYAWEIFNELTSQYGAVKFDGRLSLCYWGCFIWGGRDNWVLNTKKVPDYKPENIELTEAQLEQIYDAGSYTLADCTTAKGKGNVKKQKASTCSLSLREYAEYTGISNEMREDFFSLSYTEYLDIYSIQYDRITGTTQNYDWYTDYQGNVYEMGKANGTKVMLWQPWMKNPNTVPKNDDGTPDYRIQKGHRRASIYWRALQTSQLTRDHINPNHILFDAVNWCVHYCVDGVKFPKRELLQQVCNAVNRRDTYKSCLKKDPRKFISGDEMLDSETGEIVDMTRTDKIAANARCRKTERIKETAMEWNPNLSFEENLEEVRNWSYGMRNATKRTILKYLKTAQTMPELVKEYPWLLDLTFHKAGRSKEPITIKNSESGEMLEFDSKEDCMRYIGIKSRRTFTKFLLGQTKYNKTYEVLTK